jgi:hypothetical protein
MGLKAEKSGRRSGELILFFYDFVHPFKANYSERDI